MAHFYFLDEVATAQPGELLTLSGSEGRHAQAVSRYKEGEEILLGDGDGTTARCVVDSTSKDTVVARVEFIDKRAPLAHSFTLVQALAKTDRDERAVEATTELGINVVIPWQAERSVSRWDPQKAVKGQSKWQTIAREACKQCIRPTVPLVGDLVTSSTLMEQLSDQLVLVLDPTGVESLSTIELGEANHIALVVGPEGGISPSELERFTAAGAFVVSVGTNILRTSTAGTAALAVVMSRLGYV